jgi:hypothetical protein
MPNAKQCGLAVVTGAFAREEVHTIFRKHLQDFYENQRNLLKDACNL